MGSFLTQTPGGNNRSGAPELSHRMADRWAAPDLPAMICACRPVAPPEAHRVAKVGDWETHVSMLPGRVTDVCTYQ